MDSLNSLKRLAVASVVMLSGIISLLPSLHVESRGVAPLWDHALHHAHRSPRQAVKNDYFLDVLVIVDYAAYNSWYSRTNSSLPQATRTSSAETDIKKYYSLVLQEVSNQYGRLQTRFRLFFQPVGFLIALSSSEEPWMAANSGTSSIVSASEALNRLQNWLRNRTGAANVSYDHAMLFTGKDIITDSTGDTTGRATVGTMCKGSNPADSVSIIEDRGAFDCVATVVHELGHSLSATHDGEGNNNCPAADRYIMAGTYDNKYTDSNRYNPWYFSNCSASEIDVFVSQVLSDSTSKNCLTTKIPSPDILNISGAIPGQMYSADDQCRRMFGSQSYHCFSGNLSDICTSMACMNPGDSLTRCEVRTAATGTSCGDKSWCQVGQCVQSSQAPSMGACYKDMQVTVTTSDQSLNCAQMAAKIPALCYDRVIYGNCCQSCDKISTGISGCSFGDKKSKCTTAHCSQILSDGTVMAADCCGTCKFDVSTWSCRDVTSVDGMTCAQAIKNQVQQCYEPDFAYKCCATCRSLRDLSKGKGCEYGDRLLRECQYPNSSGQCDRSLCCHTCRNATSAAGNTIKVAGRSISGFVAVISFWVIYLFVVV